MKALTCEMCGSTDLIKQDGVFVCQSCGTKYSVEEAKKMMVEGTVSVKGVVTVDNSGLIDNYLMMASNAIDAGNQAEAENYCNKIIEINPKHVKAWLIKGKAAGWQSTLANLRFDESIKCFTNALEIENSEEVKADAISETESLSRATITLAANHFADFPDEDNYTLVVNILTAVVSGLAQIYAKCGSDSSAIYDELFGIILSGCDGAWSKAKSEYHEDDHPSEYVWKNYLEGCDNSKMLLEMAILIAKPGKQNEISAYKKLILIERTAMTSCSWTYGDYGYVKEYTLADSAISSRQGNIEEWQNKIQELDPTYVKPSAKPTPQSTSSSGCYVATAVYGSYDCPEVWTLRRFRDFTLAETWYGRAFVRAYYAISPTLVKWFGNTSWFKKMWRGPLDRMVSRLQHEGIECAPYKDRVW